MKLAGIIALLGAAGLVGQTPMFEAASIKPGIPGSRGSGINTEAARIRVVNASLKFCIGFAWDVKDFQVSGASGWIDTERFNIDAVAAKPFEKSEMRTMLQSLLADRFAVKVHKDTQEKPGYALVVGKNGPKMPAPEDDPSIMFSRTPTGDTTFSAKNVTMTQVASALSGYLRAIVVDHTELEGRFNASLQWTPDPAMGTMLNKAGEPMPPPPADVVPGPSIFSAIQEKLGLKLESRKVPVEVIVIEHAEHPTAN